jgi:hypothetical protein
VIDDQELSKSLASLIKGDGAPTEAPRN